MDVDQRLLAVEAVLAECAEDGGNANNAAPGRMQLLNELTASLPREDVHTLSELTCRLWNAAITLNRSTGQTTQMECEVREAALNTNILQFASSKAGLNDIFKQCAASSTAWLKAGDADRSAACLQKAELQKAERSMSRSDDMPAYLNVLLARMKLVCARGGGVALSTAIEACISQADSSQSAQASEMVAETLFELGVGEIQRECYDSAVDLLQQSVRALEAGALRGDHSGHAEHASALGKTFNALAHCCLHNGDYAGCNDAAKKAKTSDPNNVASEYLLLESALCAKAPDSAAEHLDRIVSSSQVNVDLIVGSLQLCGSHNLDTQAAVSKLLNHATVSPENKLKIRVHCLKQILHGERDSTTVDSIAEQCEQICSHHSKDPAFAEYRATIADMLLGFANMTFSPEKVDPPTQQDLNLSEVCTMQLLHLTAESPQTDANKILRGRVVRLMGFIKLRQNDLSAAAEFVKQTQKAMPNSATTDILRCAFALQSKDACNALESLDALLSRDEDRSLSLDSVLRTLAANAMSDGQGAVYIQCLKGLYERVTPTDRLNVLESMVQFVVDEVGQDEDHTALAATVFELINKDTRQLLHSSDNMQARLQWLVSLAWNLGITTQQKQEHKHSSIFFVRCALLGSMETE
eukprot:COSAG01_NODE_5630_length_4133_cov_1.783094_2_plen_640_part_00